MTKNYYVEGMTCQHCVASVTEEINEIPGAQGVDVDLETGRVTITGEDFSDADVLAAVTEAGFSLKQ
ncbi:heavy-metal-associated domain-containing protein [Corynebacterium felinum]|uniref:Copper chaperone CopZ n=1 Tax=Corynebacterium felinum TaxID=131318 RepID=A0ABU2B6A7_9CORY|nr:MULTISPECIES: heavy-metal-associated domain-containing protein [Corynebacterium]MDF5820612.1 heavy-metal-associated domain-containing protein [Corynebacterium felinum]MDO4762303.1 heavy-metal-associated domain-containing protein [Corynebacterium sp.]MDR7354151.1 copper chaperone CopZ [Corynebacterium felinum]WJY96323.1 Copper chaperone CopZ [Corynebacterium felinum]